MSSDDSQDNSKENLAERWSDHGSPDKNTLKAMIQEQSLELSNSRAALLQMLAVQADGGALDDGTASMIASEVPREKERKGVDSMSASQGSRQRRGGLSGNNWLNQITSRDKIIAELRARNQELKDDAAVMAAEREKLQGFARAERRLREQHGGLMAAVKSLKAQAEDNADTLKLSRQQVMELQAKLKHEASKTAMHRETQRVLDKELSAKQDVLNDAHTTLSVLHQRYTALTQVMSQATKAAFAAKLSAAANQEDTEAAQDVLSTVGTDLRLLTARCNVLLSELRLAHEARQAAEQRTEEVVKELGELQANRGVGPLAARAAEADVWQRKAAEAGEKLERMRVSYQRARKQHDAMEQRLAEAGLGSPQVPNDGRSMVVQMPLTPPTPVDAMLPHGPPRFSTLDSSVQAPTNPRDRARWLDVEVGAIRSRITALKRAFSGDPAVAALVVT